MVNPLKTDAPLYVRTPKFVNLADKCYGHAQRSGVLAELMNRSLRDVQSHLILCL